MEILTNPRHLMRIVLAWLIGVILLGMVSTYGVHAATQEPILQLLTTEEAARPDAPRSYGFASPLSDKGPAIDAPELEATEAKPFAMELRLSPRDGVAADPSTLRVVYLKSPAIDLTPRIRPFVTQEGVKISRVSLPAGLHRFRVSVSDVHGRISEKDFTIVVSGVF